MNEVSALSIQFAREYIFSTVPISHIQKHFYVALVKLASALLETLLCLIFVSYYIILFLLKLVILGFPHAVKLSKIIYDFHVTQLSASDIFVEITALTILLVSFLFRRRIQKAWKTFENFVATKSKAAAKAAPHILFFGSSLIFTVLGKNFIMPLTSNAVMPLFTLIIPLFGTFYLLNKASSLPEVKRIDLFESKMLIWVIMALYHAMVTILSFIPFSGKLLSYLPYLKEMVIVILIWAQISKPFSQIVFSGIISPLMQYIKKYIPAGSTFEQQANQSNAILSTLKIMRILNENQVQFLHALFQDSVATLLAFVFIFLPNPFATVGMITIVLLLPAFRTASFLSGKLSNNSKKSDNESNQSQQLIYLQWLNYWVCVGLIWILKIYFFTPWCSITILISLWLQHSYFNGATKFLTFMYGTGCILAERNKELRKLQKEQERLRLSENVEESGLIEREEMISEGKNNEELTPSRSKNEDINTNSAGKKRKSKGSYANSTHSQIRTRSSGQKSKNKESEEDFVKVDRVNDDDEEMTMDE